MFLVHQMAVGLFRLMGAVGRTLVIATSMGSLAVLVVVTMSGFVLAYPQVSSQQHRFSVRHQLCKGVCLLSTTEPGIVPCAGESFFRHV